ncbi:MAG: 4a-hydroxytetrahydrobiopterin dehydratase [Thiotrichales bacterium]|nr:4a-hydroxytetrahydrobiopterin dehydratase [Thiotrichales bacterium]
MNERWKQKKKPVSLDTRFDFEEYDLLRLFLDEVADVSEKLNHHANISFARTHVSIIIYSSTEELNDLDIALAEGIDECFQRVCAKS